MKGLPCLLAVCAWVGLVGCTTESGVRADRVHTDDRPNIIFILADDLGYGDLGVYGQSKIRTPHLDRMASEGIRFTSHYAGSTVCGPSRASLLTGLHTGHSPIRDNPGWTFSGKPVELKAEDVTVAEVLQGAGYRTGMIGKWAMADRDEFNLEAMPNQQGFDYFLGYKTHRDAHHYYWPKLYRNNELHILEGNDYRKKKGVYTHDLFTEEAIRFIEAGERREPFFLYLAYTIPHLALTVPEDSKRPYMNLGWPKRRMNTEGHYRNDAEGNVAYAGMVSRMDRDVGRLISVLKKRGLSENTLVIFSSDNGHEYDQGFFDSNGPLRGGKRSLYEGGIRMPFIARWPAQIEPGRITDHISAFWDFMPTACELARVKACPQNDGLSYVPTLTGDTGRQRQHDFLYWELNERQGPLQAMRSGPWKMWKLKGKPAKLFNLVTDIGERHNIAGQHPNVVAEMVAKLQGVRSYHPEFRFEPVTRRLNKEKKTESRQRVENRDQQDKGEGI